MSTSKKWASEWMKELNERASEHTLVWKYVLDGCMMMVCDDD